MFASPEEPSLDVPCIPAADSRCYLLDGFSRTLTAGTYSNAVDGGAWPSATTHVGQATDSTAYSYVANIVDYNDVESTLGTAAHSWVSPLNTCDSLAFTFDGWREKEAWKEYVVPTHASSSAGIWLGPITFFAPTGLAGGTVGQGEGALLYVSSIEPTGLRSGTPIQLLPHNVATTVYIPSQYIPAAGETLYVGVGPNWTADYGDFTCGFRWPWMDGQGTSARAYLSNYTDTIVWKSWDAGEDEWGSAVSDDDNGGAWWEGNLPWIVSPSYSGTYGIDGNSLWLNVAAGATQTLLAHMAGSSTADLADDMDDPVGEPWSHELGVVMKSRFRITTAGDTTEAGARYLEYKWNDGRDELKCQVRLGDTAFNEGLRLADSDANTFVAKAVTEGSWMCIKFDSRNPTYLRAKMWVEGDAQWSKEPPVYDIEMERTDDAENSLSDDFFDVVLSAGNLTGADQKIEVSEIWFCGPGDDCEWVTEMIGQGDGTTQEYATSQPYKKGGLWFYVDGFHVPTTPISRPRGSFIGGGGIAAAENAILVGRYLVDRNPDGD